MLALPVPLSAEVMASQLESLLLVQEQVLPVLRVVVPVVALGEARLLPAGASEYEQLAPA